MYIRYYYSPQFSSLQENGFNLIRTRLIFIGTMTKNLIAAIFFRLAHKHLLVMSMFWATCGASAQIVTPSVTDTHSYNYGRNGVFIDMSIGELAITTLETSSQIITQGFLQPISIEQPCDEPELVYYPNPVVDKLTIEDTECDVSVAYIMAYDLFGKSVLIADASKNTIDLASIGVGVYMIRVFASNDQLLGTLKIIKITV